MVAELPPDCESVRYAFRFGWAVAELRGRYRPGRFGQRDPGSPSAFARNGYELPLANERSAAETRKELIEAAEDLGSALGLDKSAGYPDLWTEIKLLLGRMDKKDADIEALWSGVAPALYKWDAHIQDALVLAASQAAAYQLGRGLAETYWALRPEQAANAMGSWAFVLGEYRCKRLRRLAARLSGYLGPEVVAAIDGPLQSWSALALRVDLRDEQDVQVTLYRQGLLWRDLVRGESRPEDLHLNQDLNAPATSDIWKELKIYQDAIKGFAWPLAGGVISIALLVAGATLLANGTGNDGLTTAASILGAIGVTSASLYAKAKANVTALLNNLAQKVQIERIRQTANLLPERIVTALENPSPPQLTTGKPDPDSAVFVAAGAASEL